MMNRIIVGLIKNRKIVIFVVVLFLVLGLYIFSQIPKQENPDTSVPAAILTTVYPGASPENVEASVAVLIEDELSVLSNIDVMYTTCMNSVCITVIMYDLDVDWTQSKNDLFRTIDTIEDHLPDGCQPIMVNTDVIKDNQFIISLSGENYSGQALADYGQVIKNEIENVDGIASVAVEGLMPRQIRVECDTSKLDIYNLSLDLICDLMMAQNLSIPSGSIQYDTGEINVNTPAKFTTIDDINNIIVSAASEGVGFVKLSDIAIVSEVESSSYRYMQDGQSAILISGSFDEGLNAVAVGNRLRRTIEETKGLIPDDIAFHEVIFSPEDTKARIQDFILNLIQSIVLIVLVVMVGIKFKNGVVISFTLPLAIFATFMVMYFMKIEFHFISIAALIISLGILVDNAIVVSEAIQQNLNLGINRLKSILEAVKITAVPVLTSTLTTIITFAILLFSGGVVGRIVQSIPIVVIAALASSYLIAMFITPVFAYMLFEPEVPKADNKKGRLGRLKNRVEVKPLFMKLLNVGLKHKAGTMIALVGTLVLGIILASTLGITFFPSTDKNIIYIDIENEVMNLDATQETVCAVQDILDNTAGVASYTSAVGKGLPKFFMNVFPPSEVENSAQIIIQTDLENSAFETNGALKDYIQQQVSERISGASISTNTLEYDVPTEADITVLFYGDDLDDLSLASQRLQSALLDMDGVIEVYDDIQPAKYEYKVSIDSDLLSTMGFIKYDVVRQINTALMGQTASTFTKENSDLDIVVTSNVASLDQLYRLPISSSITDAQVYLEQIADISLQAAPQVINRADKMRRVSVYANIDGEASTVDITNEIKKQIDTIAPPSVDYDLGGEAEEIKELLETLIPAVAGALLLIYLILLIQFKSFKKPFIILASIPLSLIGCCFGLFIFQMDIQAMAILGLVSLFGIVINNGIILVEYMDMAVAEGHSVDAACRESVDKRFRAIFLSAMTTCIGLMPLIISQNPLTAPMASVLLFGLLFSTVLTMIGVPVMYAMIQQK